MIDSFAAEDIANSIMLSISELKLAIVTPSIDVKIFITTKLTTSRSKKLKSVIKFLPELNICPISWATKHIVSAKVTAVTKNNATKNII